MMQALAQRCSAREPTGPGRSCRHPVWMVVCLLAGGLLWGCQPAAEDGSNWAVYRNSRFGFQFAYPAAWVPAPRPSNRDGQAFHPPQNPDIELRGWASKQLTNDGQFFSPNPGTTPPIPNFETNQGRLGELTVNLGPETSSLMLTLAQQGVEYHLQGRSPSRQFATYYQTFYTAAQRYQLPEGDQLPQPH